MKHFSVTFRPENKKIRVNEGITLVEAAARAGIILNTACGGKGICEKCRVVLEPDNEVVLACQHTVQTDLTVTIPQTSRFFEQKILTEGTADNAKIEPDIYKSHVENAQNAILGVAVDIGTTTVVAKLINMTDGQYLAEIGVLNPQAAHGDDVISRITYGQSDAGLNELHNLIINCINELIAQLCKRADAKPEDIYELCVVGNTTMNHIFLKLPVKQLGQAPYKAWSLDAHDLSASELRLKINPAANVHTVENIAGFVGADTTAMALATGADCAAELTLAVDIGTNGELVFGVNGRLYAASCAAGPAFEGAGIECGSRAVDGAIESVVINTDDIDVDVIGEGPARSICGSGLIDAVAVLLDLGIVDATGRFVEPEKIQDRLVPAIAARLTRRNGQAAFVLAQGNRDESRAVFLTQKDVREVQLAKGAIRAGIKLLENKIRVQDAQIEHVLLAGAFGNYIRPESALRIQLLPNIPIERIRFVGNAAASGARMILLSRSCRIQARELARNIEYVEIAHQKNFHDVFAESMLF